MAVGNPFLGYITTLGERWATLLLLRFFYRVGRSAMGLQTPAEHPVERAARLVGFEVPPGFVARPKRWQHPNFRRDDVGSVPPVSPDPGSVAVPKSKPRWKPIKAS